MKLIKCYVSSFGKLKDFTFDFTDGLNTIKEDNGWGKTTLATFIKSMFYGLNGNKRNIDDNDRKKYKPWNSTEKFGGFIEFYWGDNAYKIERYFGNKESDDTVKLQDLKTGKYFQKTDDLGKRIFGVDEEGFLSTTYFLQKDFEVKSNNSITEKFNELFVQGKTDSLDKAIERLTAESKKYKKVGNKGLIPETLENIYALNNEIQAIKTAGDTLTVVKRDIATLLNKSNDLEKEIAVLSEDFRKGAQLNAIKIKKERYLSTKEKLDDITAKKEQIEEFFAGYYPSEKELETCSNLYRDLLSIKEKIVALESSVNDLIEKSSTVKKPSKNYNVGIIFTAITAFVAILGFVFLSVMPMPIKIAFFVLLAGLIVISAYFFVKPKNVVNSVGYDDLILESQNKIIALKAQREDITVKIAEFISNFKVEEDSDVINTISKIREKLSLRAKLNADYLGTENLLSLYAKDKDVFIETVNEVDSKLIEEKLRVKRAEYKTISDELASKKASLVSLEEKFNKLTDSENNLAHLKEEYAKYVDDFNVIVKTLNLLEKTDENLKSKYKEPLENSFRKFLSKISGNDYSTAEIDIDMNVLLSEPGGSRETDYYSKGYRNLFDICKRLALVDVLFVKEKPFIILDDPFYNLDDDKVVKALELTKKLSNDYQIIYLVCHESRRG